MEGVKTTKILTSWIAGTVSLTRSSNISIVDGFLLKLLEIDKPKDRMGIMNRIVHKTAVEKNKMDTLVKIDSIFGKPI